MEVLVCYLRVSYVTHLLNDLQASNNEGVYITRMQRIKTYCTQSLLYS